jgi:hypothetical protein
MEPFEVNVEITSNFSPDQLADGAYLRSIGYKILIGEQSKPEYERIFRQACERYDVSFSNDAFQYMMENHTKEGRPLLACYPRDIISQVRDLARYEDTTPILNERVIDWAWDYYFASS